MKRLLVTIAAATGLAVLVRVGTAAPVHKVSGGGTVLYAGTLNTHAFIAESDDQGKVSGQAEFQLRYIGATIHAEVNCLAVMGKDAWIGGTITRSSNPAVVGLCLNILFRVQENGHGDERIERPDFAAPQHGIFPKDMTSQLVWGAVPPCSTTPPLGLIEWTNGNVQVK